MRTLTNDKHNSRGAAWANSFAGLKRLRSSVLDDGFCVSNHDLKGTEIHILGGKKGSLLVLLFVGLGKPLQGSM